MYFQVQLKCTQNLISVLQHPDREVSTPFIHSVAPPMMEHLLGVVKEKPTSDMELMLVLEELRMVETLVVIAEENASRFPDRGMVVNISHCVELNIADLQFFGMSYFLLKKHCKHLIDD